MSEDNKSVRQLSRRELIRIAGLGGLTVAATGLPVPSPLSTLAAGVQDETPEGFLASAYAQRAQAMTTGDIGLLDGLYDPASTTLLAFEKERGSFFKGGLSARWDNSPVLGYTASVQMLDLTLSGSTASARLYETLSAQWVPHTLQLSSEARAYRQKNPSAYQATLPRGPRGEITAGFGIRHEVTLVKGASGWRLAEDAYDERHLHAASPDLADHGASLSARGRE